MFQGALEKLDREEAESLLAEVNPAIRGAKFDPRAGATVLAHDLSFYPGHRFLDIADYGTVPAQRVFAVRGPGRVAVLDWTNGPIYALNRDVPLRLGRDNVADYARFFFSFVKGRHGRFVVTENLEDLRWKEEPPLTARQAIGRLIFPVALEGQDEDGAFVLRLCLVFRESLFRAAAKIDREGFVHLSDEELLVENMPVLDDVFGQ